MKNLSFPLALLSVCAITWLGLTACSQSEAETADSALSVDVPYKKARASFKAMSNTKTKGVVSFIQEDKGVRVVADVYGLTPGKHGFHIHELGVCEGPDAKSAGAQFNPTRSKHGAPDAVQRYAGGLGNLVADAAGRAHFETVDSHISLSGPTNIIGRSIIVYEREDDFKTQPSGNTGSRIACGVIEEVMANR